MRVLFFLPDIEAGISTIIKALVVNRPQVKDIKCEVILYRGDEDQYKPAVDEFGGVPVHRVTYSHNENVYAVFRRLKKLIHSDQDIIISNDGFELRMVTALKLKNPVVYIVHGDFDYYYKLLELNSSVVNTVITYSNVIEKKVREKISGPVIKKIYYPSAAVLSKAVMNKRANGFDILFAGLLTDRKGAHILKDIYDNCCQLGMKDFTLTIAGGGELAADLTAAFDGIKNVNITGWQPAEMVQKRMAESHVFLFPSSREGLPNVLIEALSGGAVPVSTNLESGVSDIIQDGQNGVLVQRQEAPLFAGALAGLYRDRSLMQAMRDAAPLVLDRFNPVSQSRLYFEAIAETLKHHSAHKRTFPRYSMGRLFNKKWIPNWFVKNFRSLVPIQKI